MNEYEEIVCETEAAFREACRKYGAFRNEFAMDPRGEVAQGYVRIVYRPPAPDRCPRCGSENRNHYIHSVCPPRPEFHAACDVDGDYHPWHAAKPATPPPRDEGLEAFMKWALGNDSRTTFYEAFLAGRASVKPEPKPFSQRQLDMEWNAAIETAAAIEGACCNTNAQKILCLRRPSS